MASLMEIVVPPNVSPGQKLLVKTPNGQMLQVAVPNGVFPGQKFRVQIGGSAAQQNQQMLQQQQQQAYQRQQQQIAAQEQNRQTLIQQQRLAAMQNSLPKQKRTVQIKIPAGVRPGNKITVNLPDGRQVQIVVPKGTGPGNTITINYESAEAPQSQKMPGTSRVKVVVPNGAVPGQKIRVSFEGYDYDVAVPNGVLPGSKFIAILPTALAMQQKQMHDRLNAETQKLNQQRAMLSAEKQQRAQEMIAKSMAIQEEARNVFIKYDINHDNAIDPAELLRLLQDSGFPSNVIEEELNQADMDGDNNISFEEFVVYYNHLKERIKGGAVTNAQQQNAMQQEMQELKNALLIQQQQLKQQQLEVAERNMALAQKEAAIARAEVEAHRDGGIGSDAISVEARVASTMRQNELLSQQMAADQQRKKETRQQRLREQLEAKKRAKQARACQNADHNAQIAKRGSAFQNAGQNVVTVNADAVNLI